jgi:hypothetical protein
MISRDRDPMPAPRPLSPIGAAVLVLAREVPERHPNASRLVDRLLFRQPVPEPAPAHGQAEAELKPSRLGHALIVNGIAAGQL